MTSSPFLDQYFPTLAPHWHHSGYSWSLLVSRSHSTNQSKSLGGRSRHQGLFSLPKVSQCAAILYMKKLLATLKLPDSLSPLILFNWYCNCTIRLLTYYHMSANICHNLLSLWFCQVHAYTHKTHIHGHVCMHTYTYICNMHMYICVYVYVCACVCILYIFSY